MSVLVWGVPSESPVAMVTAALADRGERVITVAPQASEVHLTIDVDAAGEPCGWIEAGGVHADVAGISGVYVRPVEPELAPEYRDARADSGLARARSVHRALVAFTEIARCRVANRLTAMSSNMSKPLQAQAIVRRGFSIPDTLVTDNAAEALEFATRYRRVVYKSTSGVRSIVTRFDPSDTRRLARLRWCPVQFQEQISGPDVRVHVVGTRVFAAQVDSEAVDYRYARSQVGVDATLHAVELDDDWAERCVALAADLDLPLAGIDLKMAPDGRVVCFEVNPSPGFPWYENEAGLPIAAAIADYLRDGGTAQ